VKPNRHDDGHAGLDRSDASAWPELLTVRDLAAILQRSVRTVERRLEAGVFPVCEIGGDRFVMKKDFFAAVSASKDTGGPNRPTPRPIKLRAGRR